MVGMLPHMLRLYIAPLGACYVGWAWVFSIDPSICSVIQCLTCTVSQTRDTPSPSGEHSHPNDNQSELASVRAQFIKSERDF
ncbi:hypothetical protein AVEN_125118-1 [Araneus ventricosus]|uniref:Uncharacterized protein n=1 Tax=Araneus ventricosus TaxID=182803 RepID=A0A4Y2FU75_ARAVE|nr:hypothetical protein AVEN_125118-1 [Araneus ventricosus]